MTFASTEPGGNKGRHHHLSWSSSRWTGFYVNIFYNWASVSWLGNLAIFIFWQCWKPSCPPEWKLGAAFGFPSSRTFFYLWTTTRSVLRGLLAGWENMPKTFQVTESWSESFFWVVGIEKSKSELYSGRKWKAKTYSLIIFPGKDILFVVLDRFFPSSWVKSLDISREVISHLHHHHH